MLDAKGEVLYVGKAKSLRQRLNSYFADPDGLHPRTRTMVRTAAGVEWTVVRNEVEALQLEYAWIKEYDPRFNIKYRDDKSYPWLCVTWSEDVPRVFVGRGSKRRGWRYFGPDGQARAIALQNASKQLNRILFRLIMPCHTNPNLIFVAKVSMVMHFACQDHVSPCRNSI